MENFEDLNFDHTEAEESDSSIKVYKSYLYQIAKCAKNMFDMLESPDQLEDWMKGGIIDCYDSIEKITKYAEYEKEFPNQEPVELPSVDEDEQRQNNNFLSNEDKRYPIPQEGETPDGFMGRCIQDSNMKNRYPVQGDRFMACMLIMNQKPENEENNPGKKFEDPMQSSSPEVEINPVKPVLP
jgi:hypothetical protein